MRLGSAAPGAEMTPDYQSMTHAQLLNLRNSLPPDDPRQPMLAAYEHQAFAREWTKDNPLLAPLSLSVAIPAYSLAKLTGLVHARTPASWNALVSGYKGIGQGLASLGGA